MKITASALSRARKCLWWARSDVKYTQAPDQGHASEGTEFHDLIAQVLSGQLVYASGPARMHLLMDSALRYITETDNPGAKRYVEIAYAYDVVRGTVRVLGENINREYGELADSEIAQTADMVVVEADVLVVRDWKTGSPEFVEEVSENAQLLSLALCAAKALSWTGPVRLEVCYVRQAKVFAEACVVYPSDLQRFASELQLMYIQIGDAVPSSGDHCRYCPALGSCPATTAQVDALATAFGDTSSPVKRLPMWTTTHLSDENDALMAEQLPALEKAVEAVKAALKDRARARGGIELSDGKVWKETSYTVDQLDAKKVEEILGPRISECRTQQIRTQFRRVRQ